MEEMLREISDYLRKNHDYYEKVGRETDFFNDVGFDSLDLPDMIAELETEHGVMIPEEKSEKIENAGQLSDAFLEAIQKKQAKG